ncbi:hypothetical protein EDD37DRAFT_353450 [Exophiala viscosa]|uniref:uncharacterized protein n=1 Tax=Exophiala viscosa TaxID=2486360 RepID=UPI00218D193F|nr:hypothetical protein EDD37DRAFT_353450 [Exophiala viscosa]
MSDENHQSTYSPVQTEQTLQRLAARARSMRPLMADGYNAKISDVVDSSIPHVVDCAVCMEAFFEVQTANLDCGHSYCRECLHEGVKITFRSKSEFRCCGKGLPMTLIGEYGDLEESLLRHFSSWLREIHCPNPLYCPWEHCYEFIVRSSLGIDTKCPRCKQGLCLACGGKEHQGVCKTNKKLTAMIEEKGWMFCPRCPQVIERSAGCNHMTCRCGARFCYRCGSASRSEGWNGCRCKVFG